MKEIFYIDHNLGGYDEKFFNGLLNKAFNSVEEAIDYLENLDIDGIFEGKNIECPGNFNDDWDRYTLIPIRGSRTSKGIKSFESKEPYCVRDIDILFLNTSYMSADEIEAFKDVLKDETLRKGINSFIYAGYPYENNEVHHVYSFEVKKLILED